MLSLNVSHDKLCNHLSFSTLFCLIWNVIDPPPQSKHANADIVCINEYTHRKKKKQLKKIITLIDTHFTVRDLVVSNCR